MKRPALDKELSQLVKGETQALALEFWVEGELRYQYAFGPQKKYFDLSSLTKILFTVANLMELVQTRKVSLDDSVQKHLPWLKESKIRIRDLLTHTSGLPAWLPLYQELPNELTFEERQWFLKSRLQSVNPEAEKKCRYSDVGFLLLGMVIESARQKNLLSIWQDFKSEYYPKTSLHFNQVGQPLMHKKELYAPTEKCPHRNVRLQGLVHDDNAYSLGGVCPHAGLFGRVRDVSDVGHWFLEGVHQGQHEISAKVFKQFLKRQTPSELGDWGLGLMLPTEGSASCGEYFSKSAFGHLGFTGTSLWVDPQKKWVFSIVANRVYFGREGKFPKLRAPLHDLVISHVLGAMK